MEAYSPTVPERCPVESCPTDASVYSGAESTKTGQTDQWSRVPLLRMRVGSVPEAILNAFLLKEIENPRFIPVNITWKDTITVVLGSCLERHYAERCRTELHIFDKIVCNRGSPL
ncbi:hypothetical protein TNCV_1165381 [Trichonephila clavipes]|nr:hypothetical protein TNCV_1165381 [Trichonephila clavipes]